MTGHENGLARDEELAVLAERCVRAALPLVRSRVEAGETVKPNDSYFSVEQGAEGRSISASKAVPNYGSLLAEEYYADPEQIRYESLDGYPELRAYLFNHPGFHDLLYGPEADRFDGWGQRWFGLKVSGFVGRLLDRHVFVAGWEFDDEAFADIYVRLERGLLRRAEDGAPLTVDVLVPLYGISFDGETQGAVKPKTDPLEIEPFTDELLAACWPGVKLEKYEEQLLLRASHVWVERDVPVTIDDLSGFVSPDGLDFSDLERFLEIASLSFEPVGIRHVLYRPSNWVDWWIGPLPSASRWGWNFDRFTAPLDEIAKLPAPAELKREVVQRRLHVLSHAPHQIKLASRRRFLAARRADPIDAVVDACIGIEALVGDDTPTDITYKLALRTVALYCHAGYDGDPRTIFAMVKNLYSRRSKIVHGKLKAVDSNQVKAFGGSYNADTIGSVVLSRLLEIVLDEPALMTRITNDDLVLDRIAQGETDPESQDASD